MCACAAKNFPNGDSISLSAKVVNDLNNVNTHTRRIGRLRSSDTTAACRPNFLTKVALQS